MDVAPRLLIVDDNPGDTDLLQEAFREAAIPVHFECVMTCIEAIARLRHYAESDTHPLPGLIILDINLPIMNGKDLLTIIKNEARLKGIPVVMFTSSGLPSERAHCSTLGAAEFICKPATFEDYIQVARLMAKRMLRAAVATG